MFNSFRSNSPLLGPIPLRNSMGVSNIFDTDDIPNYEIECVRFQKIEDKQKSDSLIQVEAHLEIAIYNIIYIQQGIYLMHDPFQ